jgi:hypothetical protein
MLRRVGDDSLRRRRRGSPRTRRRVAEPQIIPGAPPQGSSGDARNERTPSSGLTRGGGAAIRSHGTDGASRRTSWMLPRHKLSNFRARMIFLIATRGSYRFGQSLSRSLGRIGDRRCRSWWRWRVAAEFFVPNNAVRSLQIAEAMGAGRADAAQRGYRKGSSRPESLQVCLKIHCTGSRIAVVLKGSDSSRSSVIASGARRSGNYRRSSDRCRRSKSNPLDRP